MMLAQKKKTTTKPAEETEWYLYRPSSMTHMLVFFGGFFDGTFKPVLNAVSHTRPIIGLGRRLASCISRGRTRLGGQISLRKRSRRSFPVATLVGWELLDTATEPIVHTRLQVE
jgi:hypothetical protein